LSIKKRNKASDIKLVCLYATIKMTHGPMKIRYAVGCIEDEMDLKGVTHDR